MKGPRARTTDGIRFEATDTYEDGATFTIGESGGVVVCVSEEKAVDSYNQWFECTLTMTPEQSIQLRDWLNAKFPK